MGDRQLVLVANDPQFADLVQRHLQQELAWQIQCCTCATAREHLSPELTAPIVLAINSTTDLELFETVLQDCYWQQRPAALFGVQAGADLQSNHFSGTELPTNGWFRWPDEQQLLVAALRDYQRGLMHSGGQPESLRNDIAHRLWTHTPSLVGMAESLALAAGHDVAVLLSGETGVGKTYLARLLHDCSARQNRRFVVIPCGSLVANLLESELFGHVRGAFTGAVRNKSGKFAVVDDGTLLLDEIDTLSLDQQTRLLRVVETGEYEPVGSNRTLRCRARLLFASNVDLQEAVAQGKFRKDLYYRINGFSFHLPPLRERKVDILALAKHFITRSNRQFNKHVVSISQDAEAALTQYSWPGNIRQLENVVQIAVLMSNGEEIRRLHLTPEVQAGSLSSAARNNEIAGSLKKFRCLAESDTILQALKLNHYNRVRAASALGISRVTLYKKMKRYGLVEPIKNEAI